MRQFMADERNALLAGQFFQYRAMEDQVHLARNEQKRPVHDAVSGLVARDGSIEFQSRHYCRAVGMHFGMGVWVESIGLAEQRGAHLACLTILRRLRSRPGPDLRLLLPQVVG